ncbi:5,6-dimethylbenzimidazole synthase [Nostoc sp. NMS4]|uniref:5,6-dimethylbenzimidazole synthase n=1 Tax=Nostoc sp. NMS4 TaxID=2815390 RepID=UPI0025F481C3|nr:5,6-dimethylbenzimidazole synthase [Nostoc sp. NMS4]MBN3926028.1 5,6-dimethylbenzimidazole synthase [Nostoc sp. NMS4]
MQTNIFPDFNEDFREAFRLLLLWRRDVRRFLKNPISNELLLDLIEIANFSPSVGNSQPWRWVNVNDNRNREKIRTNFRKCNEQALAGYSGERASLYANLKLEGLDAAPVQLAVFADVETEQGANLGKLTMPETLNYSVVMAIHTLWLAARASGLGVGWVSIIDPQAVKKDLSINDSWELIAYLCIGYPVEEHDIPELERSGWQQRTNVGLNIMSR